MKSLYKYLMLVALVVSITVGCIKLPADVDFFSRGANYSVTTYEPVLGRSSIMPEDEYGSIFNADNSTYPLTFKITNIRTVKGDSADVFKLTFPVKVWKTPYTGLEKTREELESKREIEYHKLFEVREHSGHFIFWRPETLEYLNQVKMQPDPGYLFDVEVSNSGGSKSFKNLELKPMRPRAYEPSDIDPITGNTLGYIVPTSVSNMKMEGEDASYLSNYNVRVLFYKDQASKGNTLSFEFRDTAYQPIDPLKFERTKWNDLLHHFGEPVFTPVDVKYEVPYPIPCAIRNTQYTNLLGNMAKVSFSYDRINQGTFVESAFLDFNFAIYEPGDWKIVFWFKDFNPDFEDN